jgi:hypothetical protein
VKKGPGPPSSGPFTSSLHSGSTSRRPSGTEEAESRAAGRNAFLRGERSRGDSTSLCEATQSAPQWPLPHGSDSTGTKDLQCLKVIRWRSTIKTTFSPHQEVKMAAENVVLTPECVECHRVWRPSDREHWEAYLAYLPDEELPELAFYCPDCAEREFKAPTRRLARRPAHLAARL